MAWVLMLATIGITGIIILMLIRMIKKGIRGRKGTGKIKADFSAPAGTTATLKVNANEKAPSILDEV